MADVMTFPKTMKEFVDNYSFKDSDEVYTNGSMLIQTFRIEQAIEHYGQEICKKLAEYEQAEEDGLLIRLPCKVGDKVWLINHTICETRKTPLQCTIDEFTFDKGNRCYAVLNGDMAIYMMRRFKAVNVEQFGLTVFLTKAEAEQALELMKGT